MTKRLDTPKYRTSRALSRIHRAIVTLRLSGGSTVVALPKSVRDAVEVQVGDRMLIEYNPETQKVELSKDSEGNRQRTIYQSKNLEIIGDRIRDAHGADNRDRWETKIEKVLWGVLKHLKGDKIDQGDNDTTDDDGEDL